MWSGGIRLGAGWVVLCLAVGCGGQTNSGSNGSAGPLATCGDTCSPGQVSASCSTICNKVAQTRCSSRTGDCMTGCMNAVSMTPECSSQALAYLRCIEAMEPMCSDSGMLQYFAGCDSQQQALESCYAGSSNPARGPSGAVPSSVCPDIPRPVGIGECSAGAAGSAGGSGPATCNAACQDNSGNRWAADCSGSTCTCTYNGMMPCTCTMTGPGCSSCCPGAQ
jgi:hypothetical protein